LIGPLSVLDDRSRYAVALEQTGTRRGEAVRERLETVFAHSGVPDAMLIAGPRQAVFACWGAGTVFRGGARRRQAARARFLVWLMKQGIRRHFSAIKHPRDPGQSRAFSSVARSEPAAAVQPAAGVAYAELAG